MRIEKGSAVPGKQSKCHSLPWGEKARVSEGLHEGGALAA